MLTLCSGGQGADGKGSDKFHFPIYIHFPFHASCWGTRRDRGKGSKNEKRPQPSGIFKEGIAKQLGAVQPRASLCSGAGLRPRWDCRLCCHPRPAPAKGTADCHQSQALPAAGTGQTSPSCHCFPIDVTAGGTAAIRFLRHIWSLIPAAAHRERAGGPCYRAAGAGRGSREGSGHRRTQREPRTPKERSGDRQGGSSPC